MYNLKKIFPESRQRAADPELWRNKSSTVCFVTFGDSESLSSQFFFPYSRLKRKAQVTFGAVTVIFFVPQTRARKSSDLPRSNK
jgi:hypothetical protein